ncbi:FAD-dependent oxidoreductase [Maridesulfovibrio frigidus]|uniref:FAD-dependent oxidoreductase n=1 Tax=Maridesulfovibrio frigidus TaxID=340956 RepID=UPI0004E257CD|nr:FAD-binding protein [Maridesulfovibrio frigidus]
MNNTEKKLGISRRQFMGFAGAAAGMAALTAMGANTGWASNIPKINPQNITSQETETDVLVIGGGFAGLFAAVKAHDAGSKVLLVSKGRLGASGQTPFAKGMFVFDHENTTITIDEFVDKVSKSALGSNNKTYTKQMAMHSLARVNELREWGYFDSKLCHKSFNTPIQERKIPTMERVVITHLIKEDGRIAGAAGFSIDDNKIHILRAKSVILCTGAGGFKPNGFPICDLTHDGTIMAYKIGAKVTGKEWNDGHSGQAKNAADCFGGWHDMFERIPSTTTAEIHHDLGVEMNYAAYMNGGLRASKGPGMPMKEALSGGPFRPEGFNQEHPKKRPPKPKGPSLGGEPPHRRGVPVGGSSAGMAIHKSEGLVPINDQCESNIPGLYAAGDALGSYMSGAIYTQVGSSSTGSIVQGAIAGEAAATYSKGVALRKLKKSKIQKIKDEILAPLKKDMGYSPAWVTQTLQGIMIPNFVLYIKKEKMLKAALAYIEELRDHHMPMMRASDLHELRLAHETANMIHSAEMKLKASLMRKESRCSHFRLDYPDVDDKNWRAWINIYKGADGTMKLEKQPFDSWPA